MGDLHHEAVVVDCHDDLILSVANRRAVGQPDHFRDDILPRLRRGGVDVQVMPVYIEDEFRPEAALRRTLVLLERLWELEDAHPDDVAVCRSGAEIDAAVAGGKIALVAALEGCEQIGNDVELLRTMHRIGVRMVSFVHFGRTMLADGSAEEGAGGRLTRAGVRALAELERLGILLDVSHLSVDGVEHVLELATRPVIASHSSARALCDHHRNLTDGQLRAIAATGGVIGVNVFPAFVDASAPTIDRVVDHVEHIASVAGPDSVGLGPDFIRDYVNERYAAFPDMRIEGLHAHSTIAGLAGPEDLPALTEAMLDRGLDEAFIVGVLGGNFLRVFREVMR